jgi:hypothetical protein
MSLVTPSEVRLLVDTALEDVDLQTIIDRIELDVTGRFGPPYSLDDEGDPVTFTENLRIQPRRSAFLSLKRKIDTVVSVTEDGEALTEDDDFLILAQRGQLERYPDGMKWGARIVVEYVPLDENSRRRDAIIEIVRLTLERTAMKSESLSGDYSYTAPDWAAEREKIMRGLGFAQL